MDSPVFILSTGRTGTQFFESYINGTSEDTLCMHEPKPSRRFKFLSNLFLNDKVSWERIVKVYLRSRKELFKKTGSRKYIESSNFIFGCIPALNHQYKNIKVLHIVREPETYVASHLNHGFWKGHKKFFAKYIPNWIEKLDLKDKNNPVEILARRWNYVNEQISRYANSNEYLLLRFEDIFSSDLNIANEKLNKAREFCGMKLLSLEENGAWLKSPKNYSRTKIELKESDKDLIREITTESRKKYDYS